MNLFDEILFKSLKLILLPELFHWIGCSFRQNIFVDYLGPQSRRTHLNILLICYDFVKHNSFNHCVFLFLSKIKYFRSLINIYANEIVILFKKFSLFNTLIYPFCRINCTLIERWKIWSAFNWLKLVGKAFMLVSDFSSIFLNQFPQIMKSFRIRNIEYYK
jgi:hypothetical protein